MQGRTNHGMVRPLGSEGFARSRRRHAARALVSSSSVEAKAGFDSPYTLAQTYNAALRLVRVDLGLTVTEQDPSAAYVLFDYKSTESGQRVVRDRSRCSTRVAPSRSWSSSPNAALPRAGHERPVGQEAARRVRRAAPRAGQARRARRAAPKRRATRPSSSPSPRGSSESSELGWIRSLNGASVGSARLLIGPKAPT